MGTFRRTRRIRLLGLMFVISLTVGLTFGPSPRAHAAGATLKISPTAGVFEVGSVIDVSFFLDTGGDAINALQADILFPPDKLQVVNPVASTSFISIWVTTPTYSNTDGTIKFQGGLPNPGIKTSGGVISTVTFRVKSAGKSTIKFSPTSKVLRNDGEGTNILTSTGSAEFQLKIPPPEGPLVKSPTHSDTNKWYNNPNIQFTWEPPDGAVGYSTSFDQNAKATPDEQVDTTGTAASATASEDGIWYFHVRTKTETWGGTTAFPVQIDRTPPAGFTPTFDHDLITIEDTATLRFVTTDAASGIDHYEAKQVILSGQDTANTLFIEVSSPYVIPRNEEGRYEFIVRVFDRAGNEAQGSAKLNIVAGGVPFYARVPLLRNPAVANGALIVLGLLVALLIIMTVLRRVRIRATFQHDLRSLERNAQRKAASLERELRELHEAERFFHDELRTQPPPPQHSQPPMNLPRV